MIKKIRYLSLAFFILGLLMLFLDAAHPFHFYLSPLPTWFLIHYIDRFEVPVPFSLKIIPPFLYFIFAVGIYSLKNWARITIVIFQFINVVLITLTIVTGYFWAASAPPGTYGNPFFDTFRVILFFTPFVLFCIFCIYFLSRKDVRKHFIKPM